MDGGKGKGYSSLEPFVCAIQLKPTDDPMKEDQVQKMKGLLVDEYAVRYLESIGASATPANIARIKNEIPIQRFKLTAAFKSRGGLEDVFYLQNMEAKNDGRHLWRSQASRSTFSEMVDKRLKPAMVAAEQRKAELEGVEKERARKGWEKDPIGHKSVLPKLNTAAAAAANVPPPSKPAPLSPARRDDIASRVALARMGTARSRGEGQETSRSVRSRRARRVQVQVTGDQVEQSAPQRLMVTIEDILTIQTMFTRTFPLAHVQDRMSSEEMSMLVGELSGIPMAELVLNLSLLAEWAIVYNGDPPPLHPLALTESERAQGSTLSNACEETILRVYEGWVDMQGRVTRRSQIVLAYPIYLMLLRVCIETVMRNGLAFLFKNPVGEMNSLNSLDTVISFLLDPDGYLNYPPPAPPGKTWSETQAKRLQEETEGIPAQQNKPWSGSRGRKHNAAAKFHTVSPMMRNLFKMADSPQLRILMNHSKKGNNSVPSHQVRRSSQGDGYEGAHERPQGIASHEPSFRSQDSGQGPLQANDTEEVLTRIIRPEHINKLYLLALKKREYRREMLERARPKPVAGADATRMTQEDKEEEVLNALLPMGVDLLAKRPGRAA